MFCAIVGKPMTELRSVLLKDLDFKCHYLEAIFAEAGKDASEIAAMNPTFLDEFKPHLQDGRYFGFLAEHDGILLLASA